MKEYDASSEELDDVQGSRVVYFSEVNRNCELCLVHCGWEKPRASETVGPFIRDHFLLNVVVSGKGRFSLSGKVYQMESGFCSLTTPYQVVCFESDPEQPWEYYWIGLAGYEVEKIFSEIGFAPTQEVMSYNDSDRLKVLTVLLQNLFSTSKSCRKEPWMQELLIGGILRQLLYQFVVDARSRALVPVEVFSESGFQSGVFVGGGKYDDEYVNVVAKLIHTSYAEDIRVEKIAERLSLNRSYLSSIFKDYTGKSIKQYLTYFRIEQSLVLLKDERRSISEIAHLVGFNDPLYFSRAFRKVKSCSPMEYRKSLRVL